MFDAYEKITPANMTNYIEGLGFYHVLSLICEKVIYTQITDAFQGNLTFTKPYIYRGYDIFPVVYLNGNKIHDEFISITYQDDTFIEITLASTVYYSIGDKLTVVMFLDGDRTVRYLTPTSSTSSFDISTTDITVYEKIDDLMTDKYKGIDHKSSISYKDVTDTLNLYAIVTDTNGTKIYFSSDTFGKTYVILNNLCSYYYHVELDEYITEGNNLVVNLTKASEDNPTIQVHNKIRGLSPYPGAYMYLNQKINLKMASS